MHAAVESMEAISITQPSHYDITRVRVLVNHPFDSEIRFSFGRIQIGLAKLFFSIYFEIFFVNLFMVRLCLVRPAYD